MPEPTSDPALVLRTLRFLHRELRVNLFALKAQERKRRELDRQEVETRETIRQLAIKFQREVSAHPKIIEDLMDFQGEE